MRLGGLRNFRKPYGRITSDLSKNDEVPFCAVIHPGRTGAPRFSPRRPLVEIDNEMRFDAQVTFKIVNNFDVKSFSGKKKIILATAGILGGGAVR